MVLHYANLTNGTLCAPPLAPFTRIPSTWCEQKLWGKVAYGAGADLLIAAAHGHTVIVHDQSERRRYTRAQRQGLSWLRYACSVAWGLSEPAETSRSGVNVTGYWREQWAALPSSDRKWIKYFGEAMPTSGIEKVDIRACTCERQLWTHGNGKSLLKNLGES